MPELPEVETMRRGVLGIVGKSIRGIVLPPCPAKPISIMPKLPQFRRRAVGREIVDVDRIGKRVVVVLDSDDQIVFEPRMTGLVLVADPPTAAHLRLCIRLSGKPMDELLFWDRRGLGSVRLVSPAEMDRWLGPDKLGPDALVISSDELRSRFRVSKRAIKVALLDQKLVAGIGNLYAAEILHLASVHPEKACNRITGPEWLRIHQAIGTVLNTAIQYEGSTLSDGTYRNALNQSGSYQAQHRVYDREGQACLTCGKKVIVRIVQCQRSTFFCPYCQTKSGRR